MVAEKTTKPVISQHQSSGGSFFRKAEGEGFFGNQQTESFFAPSIQPKLSVSQPEDPQEKEADAMADQVMRMPEPAANTGAMQQDDTAGSVMRMPDAAELPEPGKEEPDKLDRKEEPDSDSLLQPMLMRKCEACEKEDQKLHARLMRMAMLGPQQSGSQLFRKVHSNTSIQAKAHGPPSSLIQRSGRDPPACGNSFESSLQSTKGSGSSLPDNTRSSLETRFGADFSKVRIHTGTQAENLSRDIHAQAFTHGGDIYFNSGKYAPHTSEGSHLLAHELTHTIQQGASLARPQGIAPKLQRKALQIQRLASNRPVPSQLNNAVAKAKAESGKVNADKEGADGFRTGWERLIEYFKTSLGEDKVIGANASYVKGAIAEKDIKKKRMITATPPAHPPITKKGPYKHDAMPSWCGIFVFWSLHKAGVPMKPWVLGGANIPREAAYPPGYMPQAGDIAYRDNFSHFAIVEKASGDTITTMNGNTAGDDNLGGQIQSHDNPRKDWTAFYDPLLIMNGALGAGEASAEKEKKMSVDDLRKKVFHVDKKESEEPEGSDKSNADWKDGLQEPVQRKPELSQYGVNSSGALQRLQQPTEPEEKLQKKEEEKIDEEKIGGQHEPIMRSTSTDRRSHNLPSKQLESEINEPELKADRSSEPARPNQKSQITRNSIETSPGVGSNTRVQTSRGPPGKIQRSWLGDAWDAVGDAVSGAIDWAEDQLNAAKEWILEKIRDFVSNIPGYTMLTVILERDPITGAKVPRTGANLLLAGLQILGPLGRIIRTLLERTNTFLEASNFVGARVDDFMNMASSIGRRFSDFIDGLSLSDIRHPTKVLDDVADLLHGVISDISGFIWRTTTDFMAMIKRIMIRTLVDFIRNRIPRLYPLLRVALGHDPVTNEDVPRNGTNILNALFDVTDDGREQRRQLQETGTFQKVAAWIDRGIAVFSNIYTAFRTGITLIWDAVSFDTLLHPIETFERIYNHFAQPIRDVWNYVAETALIIIRFIKDALLSRLSAWAHGQRGYFLITLLIHQDPFTGHSVPFTIENVIHGFMSLMDGGEAQFQQMKESGAIDRTTARVQAAVKRLNFTVPYIVSLFTGLWDSLSLRDLMNPFGLFRRVIATFAEPVMRLIAFVIEIIRIVIEVILQIMQFPVNLVTNIINRAMQAWDHIKHDPIGFLKNLLRAIKQGFLQFFNNIVDHLLFGLTGWLMSELQDAGIPELTDFSLRGVISWVLQVLHLSMETIWTKLAAHPRIGPDRVAKIRRMIGYAEGVWSFIKDVQERGIEAIWDKIQEQLSNLWDVILDSVKDWIMREIVDKVTEKLLSMLDPTGIMAVINSAIALYRAVQSFMRYLRQMLEVVNSFVEGLAGIAEGNISMAANFLEGTMRRAMPIVIGFLANQVGLGGIGARVGELIVKARTMVDEAITWLINKAVDTGFAIFDRLVAMGQSAVSAVSDWWHNRKQFAEEVESHSIYFANDSADGKLMMASDPTPYDEWVDSYPVPATDAKKTEKEQARVDAKAKYLELDAFKTSIKSKNPQDPTDGVKISGLMDELAAKTKALVFPRNDLPESSPPVYGGLSPGHFGTSMQVNVLTRKVPSGGSTADSNLGGPQYDKLNLRFEKRHSVKPFYLRGHLLNGELGGPGNDWSNLVPLTTQANKNHSVQVENKIKEKLETRKGSRYPVLKYRVEAIYGGQPDPTPLINQLPTVQDDPVIIQNVTNILQAEAFVPTALLCDVKEIDEKGAETDFIANKTIPNDIRRGDGLDKYYVT